MDLMDSLGSKIRAQRRRLGLTIDELAGRTAISKPYLSLIETGRVTNSPSELLTQAQLQRTPRDVRAVLQQLMAAGENGQKSSGKGGETEKAKTARDRGSAAGSPSNPPAGKGAARAIAALAGGAGAAPVSNE